MRIDTGVLFSYQKLPIYKAFSTSFNESRLRDLSVIGHRSLFLCPDPARFNYSPCLVHLLIIFYGVSLKLAGQIKSRNLVSPDFYFCAIVKHELDMPIRVNDAFFYHDRPDGVVPFCQNLRLLP